MCHKACSFLHWSRIYRYLRSYRYIDSYNEFLSSQSPQDTTEWSWCGAYVYFRDLHITNQQRMYKNNMCSPCTPISMYDMLPWDLRFLPVISIMRPQLWHHAYFSLMAGLETWAPRPFFVSGRSDRILLECICSSQPITKMRRTCMCCSPLRTLKSSFQVTTRLLSRLGWSLGVLLHTCKLEQDAGVVVTCKLE